MKAQLIAIIALTSAFAFPAAGWAADGAELWMKHCKKCHGDDGKGQTAMGKKFEIRDYTDAAVQATVTDEQIASAIREGKDDDKGRKVMLAFGKKLSDEEVQSLVDYMRSLKAE